MVRTMRSLRVGLLLFFVTVGFAEGDCLLCEKGADGLKRPGYFVDAYRTTCAQKLTSIVFSMEGDSAECAWQRIKYREMCCGEAEPPPIDQLPTLHPATQVQHTGPFPPCDICDDKTFPSEPSMILNLLYLGMGSCRDFVVVGRAGKIVPNMCSQLQGVAYKPCGCGVGDPVDFDDASIDPVKFQTTPAPDVSDDPPTSEPSATPSRQPSSKPSYLPSVAPSASPLMAPSISPSQGPSTQPSTYPSLFPSTQPTSSPSPAPSTTEPSLFPSFGPSLAPSISPSLAPSISPSVYPSIHPSLFPSIHPSLLPSPFPSTTEPSISPSGSPSFGPSSLPSEAHGNVFRRTPDIDGKDGIEKYDSDNRGGNGGVRRLVKGGRYQARDTVDRH
ncbi:expressed unknown protein [Seminavis robusta]|uniref:Circumsporozoite protein n=1 Tax=Seminavis robusta TaxID=568900 RepID=A0A9N8F4G7_9STRA|nr:expressed unknown protein [Seminavis robusta]|eukprot:Sro2890_g339541.1  (387) ;mRNA; f:3653-4813